MSHMSAETPSQFHSGFITILIGIALAASIACAWKLTPAADYLSPQMIAQSFQNIRASDWAVPCMIGIYIAGSMIFFPLTILIIATTLVFPPAEACAIALSGAMSSACCGYALGRYSGLHPQQFLAGRGGNLIERYSRQAGILSIALLRMVPLVPLGVIDVAMGMARIPFITYGIATLIGLLPTVCTFSLLGSSLSALWQSHNIYTVLYVALGVVVWVGLALLAHYHFRNLEARQTPRLRYVTGKIT